jgi:cytochrome P450
MVSAAQGHVHAGQVSLARPYEFQQFGIHGDHEHEEARQARAAHRWGSSPFGRVFLRHDDCSQLLKDPRFRDYSLDNVRAQGVTSGPFYDWFSQILICQDELSHRRLRSLVQRAFHARELDYLHESARRHAGDLCRAALDGGGEVDLMAQIAHWLPIRVVCDLLGIPVADAGKFNIWSLTLSAKAWSMAITPEVKQELDDCITGLREYVVDLIDKRRLNPGGDLISALVQVRDDGGGRLTEEEMVALVANIFVGSHDTTKLLCGNAVLRLLQHRDEWNRLCADPELATSATEEILRFEPSIAFLVRVANLDFSWNGIDLTKDELIGLHILAANRDPQVFPDPERLDIGPRDRRHLTFGGGPHFCVGAGLARLVATDFLGCLAENYPSLELRSDPAEVVWTNVGFSRGPRELFVQVA